MLIYSYSIFSGAQKAAKIVSEDVIVLRVNAEADNVLVMPLDVNATQMFAEIAGLGMEFSFSNLYIYYFIFTGNQFLSP